MTGDAARGRETGLRRQPESLWAIIDHAPVALAILDPHGAVVQTNRALAALVQRSDTEVVGTLLDELIPGAPEPERCLRRDDGGSIWLRLSTALLPADSGATAHTIVTFEDIQKIISGWPLALATKLTR